MSERKVLNKYYPPDFDPNNIPRLRLPKTRQYTVRIMTPCNMKCNTCGDYIAKAKKFNARKETVEGEEYLGLKIYRFYFKCPICMAEITFKTDPKNMDYELEHGATRNFQALRLAEMQAQKEARDAEEEEKLNPMKMLENRTKASRREMQELEDLEELKEMSQKQNTLDTDAFLERENDRRKRYQEMLRQTEEQEDEAELQRLLSQQESSSSSGGKKTMWIKLEDTKEEVEVVVAEDDDDDGDDGDDVHQQELRDTALMPPPESMVRKSDNEVMESILEEVKPVPEKPKKVATDLLVEKSVKPVTTKRKLAQMVKVVKRPHASQPSNSQDSPSTSKTVASSSGGLSSLCAYSDSDDSD